MFLMGAKKKIAPIEVSQTPSVIFGVWESRMTKGMSGK